MTKEQFKEWFITTDPNFPICDDIQGLTSNDGSIAFQCCSPDGMVILSNEEMQECYEARWKARNKKTDD